LNEAIRVKAKIIQISNNCKKLKLAELKNKSVNSRNVEPMKIYVLLIWFIGDNSDEFLLVDKHQIQTIEVSKIKDIEICKRPGNNLLKDRIKLLWGKKLKIEIIEVITIKRREVVRKIRIAFFIVKLLLN